MQPAPRAARGHTARTSAAPPAGRVSKPPTTPRAQHVLPPAAAPRGAHKRARPSDPDGDETMADISPAHDQENRDAAATPKRPRWAAPPELPLGLARRDFYALQATPGNAAVPRVPPPPPPPPQRPAGNDDEAASGGEGAARDCGPSEAWDDDDDAALVALVLERLRLSRGEWAACARVLGGADADAGRRLGRRWQALVDEGKVGLRSGRRVIRPGRKRRGDVREVWG